MVPGVTVRPGRCWERCPAPGGFSSSAAGPGMQEQLQESEGRGRVGRSRNKRAPNPANADRWTPSRWVYRRQAGGPVEMPRLCLVAGVVRVVGAVHRLLSAFLMRLSCPSVCPHPLCSGAALPAPGGSVGSVNGYHTCKGELAVTAVPARACRGRLTVSLSVFVCAFPSVRI